MKFSFDMPKHEAEVLLAYIEARGGNKSAVLRDIVSEKLALVEGRNHESSIESLLLLRHPKALDEYFTCKEDRKAYKIRDLPCLDEDFKCRHVECQNKLRELIGLAKA